MMNMDMSVNIIKNPDHLRFNFDAQIILSKIIKIL